ncbi:M23 family metallopeptidase [Streptomyces jumonjinensis]|uniref:M23 family metallopeptidase n=1 Tax=Streptomyces jumonjinensis TaxID=1945 RepID=A0A646KG03_STRJU|nr:M23 family metallopeptidase [Streptomyces jumonjinensis]MQT01185.1 M23 family metallopeptidase [Streptomyces jumonjinensis]
MASNSPAPEVPYKAGVFSEEGAERSVGEWNPTAETVRPVRGRHRHRVMKQRGGFARSSTVLGVGVIAAVGAGGIATAQDKPAVSISLPDMDSLPGVGALLSDDDAGQPDEAAAYEAMGLAAHEVGGESSTAAEALRSRILEQAEEQQSSASSAAKAAAELEAAERAQASAEKAEKEAEAEAKAEKEAEAERKKIEREAKKAQEAKEAEEAAEAERVAKLANSYVLPLSSYTISATYGQSGPMWSSGQHTGLDLVASTGTPLKAVGSGTITAAGLAGPYGYRILLELSDGTEILYAHMSSMSVSAGQKVSAGDMIGRVGATGNVSAAHLHMEVRTAGGSPMDPMAWLRSKNLSI